MSEDFSVMFEALSDIIDFRLGIMSWRYPITGVLVMALISMKAIHRLMEDEKIGTTQSRAWTMGVVVLLENFFSYISFDIFFLSPRQ